MIRPDNQCAGKIPYDSFEQANSSAKNLNKRSSKQRLVSYRCSVCKLVHLGHQRKGNKLGNKNSKKIDYVHKPGIHRINN